MNNDSDTLPERATDFRWSVFDDAQVRPGGSFKDADLLFQAGENIPGTPWVVVRELGQGGVGRVFEVEHELLGRKAAFKVLQSQHLLRRGLAERIHAEGQFLGAIRHANIVEAFDMGVLADGRPYLVLELLDGRDLRAELKRLGVLSIPAALEVVAQVLNGLSALHDSKIVHRDIKLENLFLCADGHVEILDLGAAAKMGEQPGERAPSLGTPRTMAPEQYEGKPVDDRTDLYALGIVLYELLTGRGPFDDVSGLEALRFAHCHRPPLPPSRVAPQFIPPEIDALVLRALAKSPRDRFASAHAMAVEIAALRHPLETNASLRSEARADSLWLGSSTWPASSSSSSSSSSWRKTFLSPGRVAATAVLALVISTFALGMAVGPRFGWLDVAVRYVGGSR